MRLLIMGGTVFVGRALAEAAFAQGHNVTLLNRGQSSATVPAGATHLKADRDGDLSVLRTGAWDAVIDTCAYFPSQVRRLLAALPGAPHYTLISSVSVYADLARPGLQETAPRAAPLGDGVTVIDRHTYGPLKVGCELEATGVAAERTLIVRPGIIVGPHDPTGRFGYWVRRIAGSGDFIVPGDGTAPLQVIDVRDLAAWVLRRVEQRTTGIFHTVGPREPITFRDFVATARAALASKARPVWVPEAGLSDPPGGGAVTFPLCTFDPSMTGIFSIDGRKALAAGLTFRPLAETIVDVSRYEAALAKPVQVGPTAEMERALLARWAAGDAVA